jgi:hypothetical protein
MYISYLIFDRHPNVIQFQNLMNKGVYMHKYIQPIPKTTWLRRP